MQLEICDVLRRRPFANDEAAPDAVVTLRQQFRTGRVAGHEAQTVRMRGQRLGTVESEVVLVVEREFPPARQLQAARRADPLDARGQGVHIDALRCFAFKAKHEGPVGAVTFAGQRERAINMHLDPGRAVQKACLRQPLCETPRGSHRSDRMRAARPNANGEKVEDTDVQTGACVACRVCFSRSNHGEFNMRSEWSGLQPPPWSLR